MRIVALEEHFAFRDLIGRIPDETLQARGWPASGMAMDAALRSEVYDLGAQRLASMDDSGTTVQVLSAAGPGAELLDERKALSWHASTTTDLPKQCREIPTAFRDSHTCL